MNKYELIYQNIRDKIDNGKYPPGDVLPGGFKMIKIFEASRDTIRKALSLLVQNGYIQKSKGRGSIVLDIHRYDFPGSGVVSFKELAAKMNQKVETVLIRLEKAHPDDHFQQLFKIKVTDFIWLVERVRKIDNEAVILDCDYLNAQIVPHLTKK